MALPDEVTESESDDIQSVDFDIDDIARQFIDPIERKRSHAAPGIFIPSTSRQPADSNVNQYNLAVQEDLNNVSVDPSEAQESRAHAFYRMIGFPVMDQDGNIYNPGFNPVRLSKEKNINQNIASNLNPNIIQMQAARELDARKRNSMFRRSLSDSSVFAVVQRFPKKFQVIDKNKNFDDFDVQQFLIKRRQQFVSSQYELSSGSNISNTFSTYSHVLRPFLVNPVIDRTVQSVGRSARICEPFLPDKNTTRLENNIFLERPGIEFVLRLRLKEQEFVETVAGTIPIVLGEEIQENITASEIRQIASAILDQQNITDETVRQLISGRNSFELINLNKLVRLINASINSLAQSIEILNQVSKELDWTPLPGLRGLEEEGKLELGTVIQKKTSTSELDRNISVLRLKAEIAKTRGVPSDSDIGSFAIEFFENTDKRYELELNDLENRRLALIRQGARALRTIEIITGEQSGLGLVDILAIYTALWAIDLDVLISLLDPQAFQRLIDNNSDLINTNVQARRSNGNSPIIAPMEALRRFESQVINILDFADKRFAQTTASPDTIEGGFIPQGG